MAMPDILPFDPYPGANALNQPGAKFVYHQAERSASYSRGEDGRWHKVSEAGTPALAPALGPLRPDERLRELAGLHLNRNADYGDAYKTFGEGVLALMGDIELRTADDFTRFALLTHIQSKLSRYCQNFNAGGHVDSLNDLSVYCMMLQEVDEIARLKAS